MFLFGVSFLESTSGTSSLILRLRLPSWCHRLKTKSPSADSLLQSERFTFTTCRNGKSSVELLVPAVLGRREASGIFLRCALVSWRAASAPPPSSPPSFAPVSTVHRAASGSRCVVVLSMKRLSFPGSIWVGGVHGHVQGLRLMVVLDPAGSTNGVTVVTDGALSRAAPEPPAGSHRLLLFFVDPVFFTSTFLFDFFFLPVV